MQTGIEDRSAGLDMMNDPLISVFIRAMALQVLVVYTSILREINQLSLIQLPLSCIIFFYKI